MERGDCLLRSFGWGRYRLSGDRLFAAQEDSAEKNLTPGFDIRMFDRAVASARDGYQMRFDSCFFQSRMDGLGMEKSHALILSAVEGDEGGIVTACVGRRRGCGGVLRFVFSTSTEETRDGIVFENRLAIGREHQRLPEVLRAAKVHHGLDSAAVLIIGAEVALDLADITAGAEQR